MTKREVLIAAMSHKEVPYVPWHINLTQEAHNMLAKNFKSDNVDEILDNHFLMLGDGNGFFDDIGNDRFKDIFGVVWDRTGNQDIGIVEGQVLAEPILDNLVLPSPYHEKIFANIEENIEKYSDRFRVFNLGFSLFERAWTLRGFSDLLMDFYLNPDFVRELLHTIVDWNIEVIKKAVTYDIDCVHFGDDWGQQRGLIMGGPIWKEFFYPELKRMYAVAKDANKFVSIHSCGDVQELFDDLVDIGVNSFNPFQPEVMDVYKLMKDYRNKLCFYGGLSTQQVLPYGSVSDVIAESEKLIEAGKNGGYIFSPAHAVEEDVSFENLNAMIQVLHNQKGYLEIKGK